MEASRKGHERKGQEERKRRQVKEETSKIMQACVKQLCHAEKLQYLTPPELSTKAAHNAQAQLAAHLTETSTLAWNTRFGHLHLAKHLELFSLRSTQVSSAMWRPHLGVW